jgi:hypothetical protein
MHEAQAKRYRFLRHLFLNPDGREVAVVEKYAGQFQAMSHLSFDLALDLAMVETSWESAPKPRKQKGRR